MAREEIEHYLADRSRRRDPDAGDSSGSTGGAACGDLVRISLRLDGGRLGRVGWDAEGCASAQAAAAAVAELADQQPLLAAARIGPEEVSRELGGLSPGARHAADLAADALHRAIGAALLAEGEGLPAAGEEEPIDTLVAISGGVDSAVAALLEARAGRRVAAVTLKLWQDPANDGERSCCSPDAVLAARHLAHSLGLPHLTLDLQPAFRAGVVEPFIAGYARGQTPNPCIACNGSVRIAPMLSLARRLGGGALATGHYARLVDDGYGPLLAAATDAAKDQTYMLAALPEDVLAGLRFPLAELTKDEIRQIAADAGLEVAQKAESQDLCFLAGEGKRSFLRRHGGVGDREGDLVDSAGRTVGRHRGHQHFTVGQRRGIGLAAPEPLYVLEKDGASNRVVVGRKRELLTETVRVRDAELRRPAERVDAVRLRYRAPAIPAEVDDGDSLEQGRELLIRLGRRVARGAPGQTAVLLSGDAVVGHGTIAG